LQAGLAAGLAIVGSVSAAAQDRYDPPVFEGRTGQVIFHNASAADQTIALWHPDNGKPFATYRAPCHLPSTLWHEGRPVTVGDDWGIQIYYLQGSIIPISRLLSPDAARRYAMSAKWDDKHRAFLVTYEGP
jgi:hypothetical protein